MPSTLTGIYDSALLYNNVLTCKAKLAIASTTDGMKWYHGKSFTLCGTGRCGEGKGKWTRVLRKGWGRAKVDLQYKYVSAKRYPVISALDCSAVVR